MKLEKDLFKKPEGEVMKKRKLASALMAAALCFYLIPSASVWAETNNNDNTCSEQESGGVVEHESDLISETIRVEPGSVVREDHTVKRLYNPNTSEHFYTTSQNECDVLVQAGWKQEYCNWRAGWSEEHGVPVYRLYNANAGDHHYTTDSHEKDVLVNEGWNYEGVAFWTCPNDTYHCTTVHRLYNPNAKAGSHHYTTDKLEISVLVESGWIDEGLAWSAI